MLITVWSVCCDSGHYAAAGLSVGPAYLSSPCFVVLLGQSPSQVFSRMIEEMDLVIDLESENTVRAAEHGAEKCISWLVWDIQVDQ